MGARLGVGTGEGAVEDAGKGRDSGNVAVGSSTGAARLAASALSSL